MALYAILKAFYNSDDWKAFRRYIIAERGAVCEDCGKIIIDPLDCEIDHCPIELTPENVHDASIALNPDNVKIRCNGCHNKRHGRFCSPTDKAIYLVYGPPLSGKTEYVKAHMQRGDIVIHMDKLYAAVSLLPEYDKPNDLLLNVLGIRDQLIDNIKTRYGKWRTAWIVGGYEEKYKREKLIADTGAIPIFCYTSREECIARLMTDEQRRRRADEWKKYIDKWFDRYIP